MKQEQLRVFGASKIEVPRHADDRGFFQEVYSKASGSYPLYSFDPQQINISRSSAGVVRGLHVAPYTKVVQCVRGSLYDVIVDVRKDSPTYLQWCGVWLTEDQPVQVKVPANCGHGFFAAEDHTTLLYFQGMFWRPNEEWSINWRDPQLNVEWPEAERYFLSSKDREAKFLDDR